ncbi:unnamed protein product [Rhizophagus irregularis]|uniref:HAT C-terminal dimerisation domain-containing protein n=1 Tax=Rhizophagus irregularis TaxID=588596 RepID=A0A915Z5C3_9GLOM|nr:unnamed protein product [Rhizophagus irregularis]
MENSNIQDYITLSENEESSDEVTEITPIPKRGRPKKSSRALGKQKMTSASKTSQEPLTALESTSQTSNNPNPFKLTTTMTKPQTKVSWVWEYFVRKQSENGEIRAYCQFISDNGEKCTKNYKYDGSTGNLSYHVVKHGITPPNEHIISENKSNTAQFININGQKEKELSTLRWILLTTQPLSTVQKDIGYEESLHLIQDISTRWNSSYLAWDRLIFLQYAVLQLNINLSCSLIPEEKADGNRLKKYMLKDNEWELLDELCNILAPFEKATRDFSGNTYVTLSQMFPIITNLTNSLKSLDNSHEEYEDSDDNTIISDTEESLTNQQIEIDYNNITEVLKNVKKNIYITLKHYWAMPDEFGIMAALLDPRYKDLNFISDEEVKVKIHSNLQTQYDQLKREMQQQTSTPPSPTISTISTTSTDTSSTPNTRSLHEYKERRAQKVKKVFQSTERSTSSSAIADEITTYFLLPVARENKNPLRIPATSVASERLFSDAGNHITAKRSLLDPGLLGKMVFLKRNMQTMDYINVFPPDLDVENNDFVEDVYECDEVISE